MSQTIEKLYMFTLTAHNGAELKPYDPVDISVLAKDECSAILKTQKLINRENYKVLKVKECY